MKHVVIAIIVCGFAAACSIRSEKVVERPAAQTDDVGIMADALRDQPRVLYEIARRIDDSGHQDLLVRDQ